MGAFIKLHLYAAECVSWNTNRYYVIVVLLGCWFFV